MEESSAVKKMVDMVVKALDDKKAEDIRTIFVADKTVIADWFVIASGRSTPHIKTLCDEVEDAAYASGVPVLRKEGYNEARWIVVDLGDVLVHIFNPEERAYYNMERLWS